MPKLSKDVLKLIERSQSSATRKALESDMRSFYRWLSSQNREGMPCSPECIAEYAAWMKNAGKKTSTIQRALSSIARMHRVKLHPNPCDSEIVRSVMRGIRRSNAADQKRAKPLLPEQLLLAIESQSKTSWPGARNRALLAVSWGGALRISETARLELGDVERVEKGIEVTIRKSKTDQTGVGYKVGIPHSRLTDEIEFWIERLSNLDITVGPMFPRFRRSELWFPRKGQRGALSVRGMSKIVADIFASVGLGKGYSTHSMRAGLITAAAAAGVPERAIQEHSRHRSVAIMRDYVRNASVFLDNPLSPLSDKLLQPGQVL